MLPPTSTSIEGAGVVPACCETALPNLLRTVALAVLAGPFCWFELDERAGLDIQNREFSLAGVSSVMRAIFSYRPDNRF